MSGKDSFLIDTNIIIYLSHKKIRTSDFAKKGGNLHISSITYIEALGYPFSDKKEEKEISELCENFDRIFLTKEIEKETIRIRKVHKIKLPDAIIAATAIVYNLTLVTHNIDDFKNIQELKILNPL